MTFCRRLLSGLRWVALLASTCVAVRAHDPMTSWATVRARDDGGVRIVIEFGAESALGTLGVPLGTAPLPANPDDLNRPLEAKSRAGEILLLKDSVGYLRPSALEIEQVEDHVNLTLDFAGPRSSGWQIEVPFLRSFPAEYRFPLTVIDRSGQVQAGEVLSQKSVVMTLARGIEEGEGAPAVPAAEAPKPAVVPGPVITLPSTEGTAPSPVAASATNPAEAPTAKPRFGLAFVLGLLAAAAFVWFGRHRLMGRSASKR